MTSSLAGRLGLHDKVKGNNTKILVDTRVVEVTVKTREHPEFEPFTIKPFVKEILNVGSDKNNVQALLETYPQLAVLDLVT